MKVGKVRVGEKLVLDDRGGIWEVIGIRSESGVVAMRCFFGSRELYGTTVEVDPQAFCYVIFEDRPKPFGREAAAYRAPIQPKEVEATQIVSSGTKIRVVAESDGSVLDEIANATPTQLAAIVGSGIFRHTPAGARNKVAYQVSETAYDRDDDTFFLLVMPQREGGRDEGDSGHH